MQTATIWSNQTGWATLFFVQTAYIFNCKNFLSIKKFFRQNVDNFAAKFSFVFTQLSEIFRMPSLPAEGITETVMEICVYFAGTDTTTKKNLSGVENCTNVQNNVVMQQCHIRRFYYERRNILPCYLQKLYLSCTNFEKQSSTQFNQNYLIVYFFDQRKLL